jgi:hypothetical protein
MIIFYIACLMSFLLGLLIGLIIYNFKSPKKIKDYQNWINLHKIKD